MKKNNTCIWCLFPAAIFDIDQFISFLIESLGWLYNLNKIGNKLQSKIVWVWTSSPLTIFPIVLITGVKIDIDSVSRSLTNAFRSIFSIVKKSFLKVTKSLFSFN